MEDRLEALLRRFELQAEVFHKGELCQVVEFNDGSSTGYVHVLKQGQMDIFTAESAHTTGRWTDQAQVQRLQANSLVFYSQPTLHQLQPLPNEEVELVCGRIHFGRTSQTVFSLGLPTALVMPIAEHSHLQSIVNLLVTESEHAHCGQQVALDRLCELLILEVLRELMSTNRQPAGLLTGLADPQLAKALTAIHNQADETWTLASLAAKAGMSRAAFANRFKQVLGLSVGQYLTTWRVHLAQSLLLKGQSVAQTSLAVGYQSPAAMARVFKTHTGLSPTDWLRKHSAQAQLGQ